MKSKIYLYGSAAIAGIGLSAIFAPLNLWYIAGFVFVPYLIVLFAKPNKFSAIDVFGSGCLIGALWITITLSWMYEFSAAGAILLYIYVALSVGATIFLAWWLVKRGIFMPLAFCIVWLTFEWLFTSCNLP